MSGDSDASGESSSGSGPTDGISDASANDASSYDNSSQGTYADHAYEHISANEDDPSRAGTLDRRAENEGFSSAPEYIDNLQGREDTRSFEAANDRVCWANADERIYGWNNRDDPGQSTVIPKKTPDLTIREFENHKETESEKLGEEIREMGPLSRDQRDVESDQQNLQVAKEQSQATNQKQEAPISDKEEPLRSARLQRALDLANSREEELDQSKDEGIE